MEKNQKILRQFYGLACPEEQVEDIIVGLNEAYTEEDLEVIVEKMIDPELRMSPEEFEYESNVWDYKGRIKNYWEANAKLRKLRTRKIYQGVISHFQGKEKEIILETILDIPFLPEDPENTLKSFFGSNWLTNQEKEAYKVRTLLAFDSYVEAAHEFEGTPLFEKVLKAISFGVQEFCCPPRYHERLLKTAEMIKRNKDSPLLEVLLDQTLEGHIKFYDFVDGGFLDADLELKDMPKDKTKEQIELMVEKFQKEDPEYYGTLKFGLTVRRYVAAAAQAGVIGSYEVRRLYDKIVEGYKHIVDKAYKYTLSTHEEIVPPPYLEDMERVKKEALGVLSRMSIKKVKK